MPIQIQVVLDHDLVSRALMAREFERSLQLEIDEFLKESMPEERMRGIPPAKRVEGLSVAERLRGLSTDEIVSGMSPEVQRQSLELLRRHLGID